MSIIISNLKEVSLWASKHEAMLGIFYKINFVDFSPLNTVLSAAKKIGIGVLEYDIGRYGLLFFIGLLLNCNVGLCDLFVFIHSRILQANFVEIMSLKVCNSLGN